MANNYRFPTQKTLDDIYFIQFEFYKMGSVNISLESVNESNSSKILNQAASVFSYETNVKEVADIIELPLQTNITENVSANYSETGTKNIASLVQAAVGDTSGLTEGLGRMLREKATKSIEGLGAFVSGASRQAINEQMQVVYEGPNKRKYSFEISLYPRNNADSRQMVQIKKRLQYNASPSLAEGRQYFSYPNMVRFKFFRRVPGESDLQEIEELFQSKFCYIESVNIESGDDGYREFIDNNGNIGVNAMKIGIELMEAEYMLQKDFEDSEDIDV